MDLYSSVSSVSCASGTNAWSITGAITLDGVGPGDKVWVGSRTASTAAAPLRMFRIETINRTAKTFTTSDNADQTYTGVPFFIEYDGAGLNFLSSIVQTLINRLDAMFGIGSAVFMGGGTRFLLSRQSGSAALAELMFGLRIGDTTTAAFFLRQRQVSGVEVLDFITTENGTTEVVAFRITRAGVISFPSSLTTAAFQAESLNGGPLGGFRNLLVNGGFALWQRGTSGFSAGSFAADRWSVDFTSAVARSTDVPDNRFLYSIEFGNASASFPLIQQRISAEDARAMFNRTMTLSFWAKNVSGSSPLVVFTAYANTYNTFSSPVTAFYNDTTALSSAWTRYSFNLGTHAANAANGYQVQLFRTNAAAANTRITGVQLECGPVVTPYEFMGDRGGTALEQMRAMSTFEAFTARSENGSRWVPFKVRKRTTPTVTVSAGTASNITVDGFELSHTSAIDVAVTASAEL